MLKQTPSNYQQIIRKLGFAQFRTHWKILDTNQTVPNSIIQLDFSPFVRLLAKDFPDRNYCLVHWQAKPMNLRRWGVYFKGEYFCGDNLSFPENTSNNPTGINTIQLSDIKYNTKPISIILLPCTSLKVQGNLINII